jgi:hypothetical protein
MRTFRPATAAASLSTETSAPMLNAKPSLTGYRSRASLGLVMTGQALRVWPFC